jgi:hypothetical protein
MPKDNATAAADEAATDAPEAAPEALDPVQVEATMRDLCELDAKLREHGSSILAVLLKSAHNTFGIVL